MEELLNFQHLKSKMLKNDQGQTGLSVLLSLVTMLFVIGLIVMIFALMGGELADAVYESSSYSFTNLSTVGSVTETGSTPTTLSNLRDCSGMVVTQLRNSSNAIFNVGNGTITGCSIACDSCQSTLNGTAWKITGTANYDADTTASHVMANTTGGISSVTDWFGIFIVIGAMVVLILLTVIIITAIRSSGLMNTGTA